MTKKYDENGNWILKIFKLYEMAIMQYYKNFKIYYDKENDKLYYTENPSYIVMKKKKIYIYIYIYIF